jgi:glutathione S-transferase
MQLMYAPQSPFSRKVRACAIELGLDRHIDLVYTETIPGRPNTKYVEAINPLGKIPALIDENGAAIFDSTVICEYLANRVQNGAFLGRDAAERIAILTRHAVAQGICEALVSLRYETWLRPAGLQWDVWTHDQWRKIYSGLNWFEDRGANAMDEIPDLADTALGCAVGYGQFRWPEKQLLRDFPEVDKWWRALASRPSFATTMPSDPPSQ